MAASSRPEDKKKPLSLAQVKQLPQLTRTVKCLPTNLLTTEPCNTEKDYLSHACPLTTLNVSKGLKLEDFMSPEPTEDDHHFETGANK